MKVSMRLTELQELGLLEAAARLIGSPVIGGTATATGIQLMTKQGIYTADWGNDSFTLTLSQLRDLGFDVGTDPVGKDYCQWCKK